MNSRKRKREREWNKEVGIKKNKHGREKGKRRVRLWKIDSWKKERNKRTKRNTRGERESKAREMGRKEERKSKNMENDGEMGGKE